MYTPSSNDDDNNKRRRRSKKISYQTATEKKMFVAEKLEQKKNGRIVNWELFSPFSFVQVLAVVWIYQTNRIFIMCCCSRF